MATISQDEVRLLITNTLTVMRDRIGGSIGSLSSTMLRHELKACAGRLLELTELLGPDNVVVSAEFVTKRLFTDTENVKALDEMFTQKGM